MSIAAIERCWSWGRQQIAQEPSALKSLLLKYVNIAIPIPLSKGGTGAATVAGARANLGIAADGGFADAPNDGSLYGRRNRSWQAIVGEESFLGVWDVAANNPDVSSETPSGGQYFIVSVAGTAPAGLPGIGGMALSVGDQIIWSANVSVWVHVPNPGVPDAPSDGTLYGRQDGAWEPVQQGLAPTDVVPIAQGGTGAITAPAARTALGVDTAISTAVAGVTQTSLGGPFLPLAGGTLTGTLTANAGVDIAGSASSGIGLAMEIDTAAWAGIYAYPLVGHSPTLTLLDLRDASQNPLFRVGVNGTVTVDNNNGGDAYYAIARYNPPATQAFRVQRLSPGAADTFIVKGTGETWIDVDDAGVTALDVTASGAGSTALRLNGKAVTFGANDSAAPGYRTMMIEN